MSHQNFSKTKDRILKVGEWLNSILANPRTRKIIYILFIIQAVYIAMSMKIGIPPDELTHIRFIEYYRDHSLSPFITEQSSGFAIGDVTREVSYLYHYLMSLLLRVLPFSMLNEYIILRFVGIGLSLLTLITSVKTMKLLKLPPSIITLGLLITANFSEFLLMSSSINNDNAVWLLTALGFYFSVQLWQQREKAIRPFLYLALVISFGAIVKKTFLPKALVFSIFELGFIWWHRQHLATMLKKLSAKDYLLIVLILFGIGLTFERVGVNVIKYRHVDVICDQIHEVKQCLEFGVYRRNYNLPSGHNLGAIPLFFFVPAWLFYTFGSIFGTQSWVGTFRPPFTINIFLVFIFFVFLIASFIKRKEFGKNSIPIQVLWIMSIGYIVINLVFNYLLYEKRGRYGLALQGRYIFPILPTFVILGIGYFNELIKKSKVTKVILSMLFIATLFGYSSLSGVISSHNIIEKPFQPIMIFDRENAISKFEPSI